MYIRTFRTYKSVDRYSCITVQSELTRQLLCTHVSQSNHNLQPVMAASRLQELAAMRNLTTCELDKSRHLVTDVRTSKRHMASSTCLATRCRSYLTHIPYTFFSLRFVYAHTFLTFLSHSVHICFVSTSELCYLLQLWAVR